MTEQENAALIQLREDFLVMQHDVARILKYQRRFARLERGLLGDALIGDMGLFAKVDIALTRVANLEQAAKDQKAVASFLKSLANLTPVAIFGLIAFASTTGIDLGFILQLLGAR